MTRQRYTVKTPFGQPGREPFNLEDPEEVVLPLHEEEPTPPGPEADSQPDAQPEAARAGETHRHASWRDTWEEIKAAKADAHARHASESAHTAHGAGVAEGAERAQGAGASPDAAHDADHTKSHAGHGKYAEQAAHPGHADASGADTTTCEARQEPCPNCAEAEKSRLLAFAELENVRKRLTREKEDFIKFAGEKVISDILPALDNLDLALAYAPQDKESKNFVMGVEMTRKQLLDALSRHGLEVVGAVGETFDPTLHEAMGVEASSDHGDGQVCKLLSRGYKLKDRLLRPAKVMVCKNGA